MRFNKWVKYYGFQENVDEPWVYKYFKDEKVVFLVIYVDEILFENDMGMLTSIKVWLSKWFDMKYLSKAKLCSGYPIP